MVRPEKVRPNVEIRRILVPVDFTDVSQQIFGYAISLSKQFNAELDLVHVLEPFYSMPRTLGLPLVASDLELEQSVRHHLHEVARSQRVLLCRENVHVVRGRAFEGICRLAAELGADLIAISTHGNTGLKHFALGSTAERVVRHSPCPVLVIRPRRVTRDRRGEFANKILSFSKIVVPVDFSDCSLKGLAYAKRLARQFGSTLVLLHCLPPKYYAAGKEQTRYDPQTKNTARDRLLGLVKALAGEGIQVGATLEVGHVGQQICGRAEERQANLIVTATHGNTGLRHVLVGSTAEYVVRHAASSVLVVPTRERPLPK